jgi:hypothetical protein
MKSKNFFYGILVLIGIVALVAGCAVKQPAEQDELAIVQVTIGDGMLTAKTIEPDNYPMVIQKYVLKWWLKSDGDTEPSDPDLVSSKIVNPAAYAADTETFLLLVAATYKFKVDGHNADPPSAANRIGESEIIEATFKPSKIAQPLGPLTVKPIGGSGDYQITVQWPDVTAAFAGRVDIDIYDKSETFRDPQNPAVKLTDYSTSLTFTDTDKSVVLPNVNELPTGYYKCVISMYDDASTPQRLWSTIDALRIIDGQISTEIYTLKQQLYSLVTANIVNDMQNPLEMDLFVQDKNGYAVYYWDTGPALLEYFEIDYLNNIIAIAYPEDPLTKASVSVTKFEWFLDGSIPIDPLEDANQIYENTDIANGTTYSEVLVGNYNERLNPGSYQLTVLVTKGESLSSKSIQFIIWP